MDALRDAESMEEAFILESLLITKYTPEDIARLTDAMYKKRPYEAEMSDEKAYTGLRNQLMNMIEMNPVIRMRKAGIVRALDQSKRYHDPRTAAAILVHILEGLKGAPGSQRIAAVV